MITVPSTKVSIEWHENYSWEIVVRVCFNSYWNINCYFCTHWNGWTAVDIGGSLNEKGILRRCGGSINGFPARQIAAMSSWIFRMSIIAQSSSSTFTSLSDTDDVAKYCGGMYRRPISCMHSCSLQQQWRIHIARYSSWYSCPLFTEDNW